MSLILDEIEKKTKEFKELLKKYPEKRISEYTRLVDQLDVFLMYGFWSRHEEEDEE